MRTGVAEMYARLDGTAEPHTRLFRQPLRGQLADLPWQALGRLDLTDPTGQPIEFVGQLRDQIRQRVTALLADLLPNTVQRKA